MCSSNVCVQTTRVDFFKCQSYLYVDAEKVDDAVSCRWIPRLATPLRWLLHSPLLHWLATEQQVQTPNHPVQGKNQSELKPTANAPRSTFTSTPCFTQEFSVCFSACFQVCFSVCSRGSFSACSGQHLQQNRVDRDLDFLKAHAPPSGGRGNCNTWQATSGTQSGLHVHQHHTNIRNDN